MKLIALRRIFILFCFFAVSCYVENSDYPGSSASLQTSSDSNTYTVTVKTKKPKGYNDKDTYVLVGGTIDLDADVETGSGIETEQNVTWSSIADELALVDKTGLVTIPSASATPGSKVIITATLKNNDKKYGYILLTVYDINDLTITSDSDSVEVGDTLQLSSSFSFLPKSIPNELKAITWVSSDTSRATVDSTGLVTARKAGDVVISAIVSGKSVDKRLTITPYTPEKSNSIVLYSLKPFSLKTANETKNWEKANGNVGCVQWSATGSNKDEDWSEWNGKQISASSDSYGHYCIYLRGKENVKISNDFTHRLVISSTDNAKVTIDGNMMNLLDYRLDYSNPANLVVGENCFTYLFRECIPLETLGENFSIPATTLGEECYSNMFYGCTSLISTPALPATTLSSGCYSRMFFGCTSLVSAPALPATKLVAYCYKQMFYGCTSLVSVPALPDTNLPKACFSSMFENCSSLKFSTTKTGEYVNEFRIGNQTETDSPFYGMLDGTGGTFKGGVTSNTTYWTSNEIIR